MTTPTRMTTMRIAETFMSDGAPNTAIDPVCGMTVTIKPESHRAEHDGRMYYFCSQKCRAKFIADPREYVHRVPLSAAVGHGHHDGHPHHAGHEQHLGHAHHD